MTRFRAFLLRVRALFSRRHLDTILDEELRAHQEMLAEDLMRSGMSADQARREARLRLGGIEQTKEIVRDARGFPFLDELGRDLRYAVRTLAKTPAFTAFAVLTLALGIGATTAMFTVVNGVLLRPFPLDRPEQLVAMYEEKLVDGKPDRSGPSPDNFVDWRARARTFDAIALFRWPTYNLVLRDQTDVVRAMAVTSDFFRVMRVQPALGRVFAAGDYPVPSVIRRGYVFEKTSPKAVILAHHLWQRAFGGSPDVLGRTVRLDRDDMTIVGVMPNDFTVPAVIKPEYVRERPDCWVPDAVFGNENRRVSWYSAIGRVRDDVSLDRAQGEMRAIGRDLAREYPRDNGGKIVRVVPLRESVVGEVRPQLRVLASAVAFVLLIACANVANLLLVRVTARRRELATRSALGAGRARLVRQLLTETMLIACTACAFGLLLAWWIVLALVRLAPPALPRMEGVTLDLPALVFAVVVTLLTGVLCGLVPALQSSKIDVNDALKDEGPTTMGRRRRWLSNSIVVCETALALALLVGAGLMVRTFLTLHSVDVGFRPDHALTVGFNVPARAGGLKAGRAFYRTLLERLKNLPDVESAAIGGIPISSSMSLQTRIEGRPDPVRINAAIVTDGYFRTVGIRLVAGRLLLPSDSENGAPVAVVSRSLAARAWTAGDAIGRRLATDGDPATDKTVPWVTVVGVVEDTRNHGLEEGPAPLVYLPLWQNRSIDPENLVLRTAAEPTTILPAVRAVVRSVDRDRAVTRVATLDERILELVAPRRFNLFVIGIFSVLAFALAIVGVYAVVAHTVALRTREIGTRMVLGANRANILALVARQNGWLIATGELAGLAIALALNHAMTTLVFGVTTTDAPTYVITSAVFAAVALVACYVPGRRATRIDPLRALRTHGC